MWNWRLLAGTGEARYADWMETTLYNGVLAGLSLDGEHYFYVNPLIAAAEYARQAWFDCACCPPNLARLLASLPGYLYGVSRARALGAPLRGGPGGCRRAGVRSIVIGGGHGLPVVG